MKNIKTYLLVLAIFSGLYTMAQGSVLEDRYYVGEKPGAAAIARGGAYTAVADDSFAAFWNPAGLARLRENSLGISMNLFSETELSEDELHANYPLQGQKLNFISISAPEVSLYWRPLSNISLEESDNGVTVKRDVKVNTFGLSVGIPHTEKMDFGMNINFLFGTYAFAEKNTESVEIGVPYGYGWGLDWGMIYEATEMIDLGLTLLNGPAMIYWGDGHGRDSLPVILKGGANLRLTRIMSASIDYSKGFYDDSLSDTGELHFGLEHNITNDIALRAGIYGSDLDDRYNTTYTAGVGYSQENYRLNLAARQFYIEEDSVIRVSLSGIIPF